MDMYLAWTNAAMYDKNLQLESEWHLLFSNIKYMMLKGKFSLFKCVVVLAMASVAGFLKLATFYQSKVAM